MKPISAERAPCGGTNAQQFHVPEANSIRCWRAKAFASAPTLGSRPSATHPCPSPTRRQEPLPHRGSNRRSARHRSHSRSRGADRSSHLAAALFSRTLGRRRLEERDIKSTTALKPNSAKVAGSGTAEIWMFGPKSPSLKTGAGDGESRVGE